MAKNLFRSFIRSAVNQVGRDGGKVISNSLYGDRHSTPIRRVGGYDKSASPAAGSNGKAVVRQNVEVSNWGLFWYLVLGFLFAGFGSVLLIYNGLKRLLRKNITLKRMVSKDIYIPDENSASGKRFAGHQEYIEKENVPSTEYELRTDRRIGLIYYVAGIAFLVINAIMYVHSESLSLGNQVPYIDIALCVGGILVILLTLYIINNINSHHLEKMRQEEEKQTNLTRQQRVSPATMEKPVERVVTLSDEEKEKLQRLISSIDREVGNYWDPMLVDVAAFVISTQQASASTIQRKFSIGYNRAGRLMDQLEKIGIVGPAHGSKPHEVLTYNTEDVIEKLKEYDSKIKKLEEEKEEALRRKEMDEEKEKIKQEIRDNKRKKELREQAMQELQDEGVIEKVHKREPIPQEVQDAVWRRDGGRCVKCGSQENLEFDHIIPFSKGGSNTVRNLQLLCQKCNREKSNHIG